MTVHQPMAFDYRNEGRRKYPVKKVPSMTVPDTSYYVVFGVPKDQAKTPPSS